MKAPRLNLGALQKEVLMCKHHKHTIKRPRKPLKPSEIAALLAALGTALMGLAALIKALS